MATLPVDTYGVDLAALSDLPDPEATVNGIQNVAYAVARRWLTQQGALVEIGDTANYTSFDLRDYFGARLTTASINQIQSLCETSASEDPRVQSVSTVVTLNAGLLKVAATVVSAAGPFDFVLSVDGVSASLMLGA